MVCILACHVGHVQLACKALIVRQLVPHLLHFVLLYLLKDGCPIDGPHILVHASLVVIHAETAGVPFVRELVCLVVCLLYPADAELGVVGVD